MLNYNQLATMYQDILVRRHDMTEPILQVRDLSVYYNKKKALNNVSMDFYLMKLQLSSDHLVQKNQHYCVQLTVWVI